MNASVLGRDHDLGTIEPGKLADIAVVKGGPLFDIVVLSNIDIVVKNEWRIGTQCDFIRIRDPQRTDLAKLVQQAV